MMKALLFSIFTFLVLNLFAQEYGLGSSKVYRLEDTVSAIVDIPEAELSIFLKSAKATSGDPNDLWKSFPLYGGEMTSIVMNPENRTIIYVGTRDAGVFKTINGGQTWSPARTGLTFYPIRCMTMDPGNPEVIYAGTDNDGIWKTTNGGNSWNKTAYPGSLIVFNIVINPLNPQVIYAGSAGGIGLGIGNIHKSSDGGETWELKDQGLPYGNNSDYTNGIFSLAMEASNPDTLYAGTNYIGVYRTTDGGENWASFSDSILPVSIQNPDFLPSIIALATNPFKPGQPGALLNGRYYFFNGDYWQQVNSGYNPLVGEAIHPGKLYYHIEDSTIVYTNRSFSSDAGLNWEDLVLYSTEEERHSIVDLVFPSTDMQTIVAATDIVFSTRGGVIKSDNQGGSWEYASEGITAVPIFSIAVDANNPDHIYTGTGSGHFFSSDDGGLTWERGFYYIWYQDENSNQKSFAFSEIKSIEIDPSNASDIYIGSFSGLYKSEDRGRIFSKIDSVGSVSCMAITSDPTTTIYVGGTSGLGILKSIDKGASWESKNSGLPDSFGGSIQPVTSIAIDPNNSSVVWAGTQYGGGILRTDNGGDQWIEMGLTEENIVRAIAINPGNSDEILVGTEYFTNKIYKSDDGGQTWQLRMSDIAAVQEFLYDPRDSRQIYAATEGYGMMRSIDGGETWDLYNEGIFYPLLYSIEVTTETPPKLLTGSYGSGLYWTTPSMPVRNFNASTVSKTEIDLTWNLNINNDKILVAWSPDENFGEPVDSMDYSVGNSISGGGTVIYVGTGTGFNHTSLLPGSYYYYKAWTQGSDEKYSSGETDAAFTLCEITFPFTEDFSEGTLPVCWQTIDQNDQGYIWLFDNPGERGLNSTTGSNGFAIFDYEYYSNVDSVDASLVSPLFDFSSYSKVQLKFEHCFKGFATLVQANLFYSLDKGMTWLLLNSWESNQGTETSPALYSTDISDQVAAYSDVMFKWNYSGSSRYYWMIDDVEISSVVTGIENAEEIDAIVYPNPSDGVFELRLNKVYKNAALNVVDLSGNVLFHKELNSTQHTIDLSSFSPGVYIARVSINNKLFYKKLVCK